jgi:hypothetical protein
MHAHLDGVQDVMSPDGRWAASVALRRRAHLGSRPASLSTATMPTWWRAVRRRYAATSIAADGSILVWSQVDGSICRGARGRAGRSSPAARPTGRPQ